VTTVDWTTGEYLVVIVDARAEVAVVAVMQWRPQKAASLGQDIAPVRGLTRVDVVVHLFAFLPEQRSTILVRTSARRNCVLGSVTIRPAAGTRVIEYFV